MSIELPEGSGIIISGKLPCLQRGSWFEPPIVIQATLMPMNLIQIGAFTGIFGGRLGSCKIGRYCSIAYDVDIASDQHPTDWLSTSMLQYVPDVHGWGHWLKDNGYPYFPPTQPFNSKVPAEIGNDVWIGQGVFIKSGVKIGDGAIIAAHSVVVNDIPPYAIAAGVPAVVKKMRFDEVIINELLELKWWNYSIASIDGIDFKNISFAIKFLKDKINKNQLQQYSPITYKES